MRTFLLFLMGVLAFTGLLLAALFARSRRYLTFVNRGGSGLFNVIQTASNSAEVERLLEAIRAAAPNPIQSKPNKSEQDDAYQRPC